VGVRVTRNVGGAGRGHAWSCLWGLVGARFRDEVVTPGHLWGRRFRSSSHFRTPRPCLALQLGAMHGAVGDV